MIQAVKRNFSAFSLKHDNRSYLPATTSWGWGRGSSWSSTRDRFSKHLLTINFDRANDEALRRIARRVLREENLEFDDEAIEELVKSNPGDLRALVRDLQVLSATSSGRISKEMVQEQSYAGHRDTSEGVFQDLRNYIAAIKP